MNHKLLPMSMLGLVLCTQQGNASPLIHEGFEYTDAVGTSVTGLNGGIGFTSAWESVGNPAEVSGVLTTGLGSGGGKAWLDDSGSSRKNKRPIADASNLFDDDETYWFSYRVQHLTRANTTMLWFGAAVNDSGSATGGFGVGFAGGSSNSIRINVWGSGSGAGITNVNFPTLPDQEYIVVGKIAYQSTSANDVVDVWVNPVLTTESALLATPTTISRTSTNLDPTKAGQYLFIDGGGPKVIYDEIRLGNSFSSVIPEPATMALLSMGGLLLISSRCARR